MNNRSGFTLVEIMVVIVVVGLLAALAVPRYNITSHQVKAKEADVFLGHVHRAHETWATRGSGTTTLLAELQQVGYSAPARMEYYVLPAPDAFGLPLCLESADPAHWPNRGIDRDGQLADC
jgi:prepilin-type N-terminal cleavage/methylation domain-containing protein